MINKIFMAHICIGVLCIAAAAQVGGPYEITQSVIAGGGAQGTAGGSYVVDGTVGQSAAGTASTGGQYSLRGGFWAADALAPTASVASISGRIFTADGRGINSTIVSLMDQNGNPQTTISSSFGYYRFDGLPVGQTYIIEVRSKGVTFAVPTRVITLNEDLTDVDFVADSSN